MFVHGLIAVEIEQAFNGSLCHGLIKFSNVHETDVDIQAFPR